ncbi:MAG: class I SAM-dependent methyltransferase [Chloroflexi bacterium]|nr:class I SAM-dependent methyltransferase [Chloroflexota bacterium]
MKNNDTHRQLKQLSEALWRIYRRAERPLPWQTHDGNLPWDDPDFSARMLREHLDESHGAASRQTTERNLQIEWLWPRLDLQPGCHLLDVTCGPGLYAVEFARRGCHVTGVDFSPAAIAYARDLAHGYDVASHCTFTQQDVRQFDFGASQFDAAILLYGQLAVMKKEEAQTLLSYIAQSLKPGGKLCVELLNQEHVDKRYSNWWFTDDAGLWGNDPFLHLGERFWLEEEQLSVERFYTVHLESGEMDVIELCDQTYAVGEMVAMMRAAGFTAVTHHPAWDNLPLYDAHEWHLYVAVH